MSHFNYLNDVNSFMSIEGAITKGPTPRWQKRDADSSTTSANASINVTKKLSSTMNNTTSKTPSKNRNNDVLKVKQTPSKNKNDGIKVKQTPSKTPGKTPNKTAKTPSGGDRFIPNRANTNFEMGNFMITQSITAQRENPDDENVVSAKETEMQRLVGNACGSIPTSRILAYSHKAPAAPDSHQNPLKVVYSQTRTPASTKGSNRYIPQAPDRILDAPEIIDDFYLNLLDWSPDNILAVALGTQVYLWDADTGAIEQLLELGDADHVCSLKWVPQGSHLAVGTTQGSIELWDCSQMKRLRIMTGHAGRVGSLSWNNFVLSSGSRTGQIMHSDVRQQHHSLSIIEGHSQEVCGLTWSPDGKYLASGGNDNILNIWAVVPGQFHGQATPLHTFTTHQAAVKALAWCPWHPHILASGGGTADRCINIWNITNGHMISRTDTQSQVCSLAWAPEYKELVSGHGYANNQLIIWRFPSMTKQAELTGHSARILQLAMSPDGTTVLSAGADETLRLWKCFVPDPHKKKSVVESRPVNSILRQCIR